jgi:hypothetical protein
MKASSLTSVWIAPGERAAYPSLEAARKSLQAEPPNVDQVVLRRYELDSEQISRLKGSLTDDQGKIARSLPKRALDGLSSVGSLVGSALALGGAVASLGTLLGALVFAPSLLELSAEAAALGVNQLGRALTGESHSATLWAQQRTQEALQPLTPQENVTLSKQLDEWTLCR